MSERTGASKTLIPPPTDPAPLFDLYRGSFATELLTAAVAHFDVFGRLSGKTVDFDGFRAEFGLEPRPAVVLLTALKSFRLLQESGGRIEPTELARRFFTPNGPHDIGGYIALSRDQAGVLAMVEALRANRPAGSTEADKGAAFIYRDGIESAMEREESARSLTLALAGRARNVAPVLADRAPLAEAKVLLDVAGGSGLYAIAYLERCPDLRAIVWDRPEVLKVAAELGEAHGVADRLECRAGDMFADPFPEGADAHLFSNVLHDWDVPQCRFLLRRSAEALPPNGRAIVHDVFLNDALDGPMSLALYSAALFALTEGRAYSRAEYEAWAAEVGLEPLAFEPTLVQCAALVLGKRAPRRSSDGSRL